MPPPRGPEEPAEGLIEGILQAGDEATPLGESSELLTFLFADIRGYTKFTQQRGDEAASRLTGKFAQVVRDLVQQFAGTVFELRGDEAMCVFASPRQSLRLAVALQQRFVDETAADPTLPMTVGIGVDAGEAVRSDDGYRGGALNLAARLCSLAKPGEVLASREVTHLARAIDGVRYVVLDRVTLKGLPDPVRPVRVVPEGEDPSTQLAALIAGSPSGAAPALPWLPGPLSRMSRRKLATLAAVTAAVVAGVAVVAVLTVVQTGGSNLKALGENSVGVVDPASGRLVSDVAVDTGPSAVAAGYGSVWTANTGGDSVSQINTTTDDVKTIIVGAHPSAIAAGLGSIWVANDDSGTVTRIEPGSGSTQTIVVGDEPAGVAVAAGSVWVTNSEDGTVSRIDPSRGRVVETIQVGDDPTGIAAGRDVWVADSGSNTVSEITGSGDKYSVAQTIHVGNDPQGIAIVGNDVWVTNNLDGTVAKISTTGTSVDATVYVGAEPTQIAGVHGDVWVATQADESLAEIDPASPRVVRTVHVGVVPGGVTAVSGRLWVTATIKPAIHRGGTIRILGRPTGTIDPTYVDTPWTRWLLNGTYDGLVGFRVATGAAGTALVPDLATAIPDPTNGGLTYSFHVRSGVRWSTGKPLTVFDVQRGIERNIVGGFSSLGEEILGAGACRPSSCHVRGISVDAATRTVTITLTRPNSKFLDELSYAVAAPAATPLALQDRPIPTTGPYRIAHFEPGKLVVLTRNPYFEQWSAAAQPGGFPAEIEWQVDASQSARREVAAVAAGRADWGDARGAAPVATLESRFGSRLIISPTETTQGLVLNTRIPPFNNELVRRALADAVQRRRRRRWFSPATVTCQALPPDYPGHRSYCPSHFDPVHPARGTLPTCRWRNA